MSKDQQQKQFVVQLSEPEIQMVIQSVIDDLGDVRSAHRWVRNKLHSVNHQILTEGFTQQSVQSRDEWAIIDRYFERNSNAIERWQKTTQKMNPS
jgi:D-mannonate dehydratase